MELNGWMIRLIDILFVISPNLITPLNIFRPTTSDNYQHRKNFTSLAIQNHDIFHILKII